MISFARRTTFTLATVGLAVFSLAAFSLPACSFAAAAGPDTLRLDLEKSVALALEKNPEIRMAEKEASKAKAGVAQAVASLLPSVSGSLNFQHNWDIQQQVIPNFIKAAMRLPDGTYALPGVEGMPDYLKMSFGVDNTFMYGATLTMPVFLGGAGWAGVRIANAVKHTAEQALETKRQGLIHNTAAAYYGCLLARDVIAVQEQAVAQSQGNLDLVRKKFEAGTASGFDKMRAEVDLANLQPQLISTRSAFQSAVTGLRMLMGLPEAVPISIEGRLEFADDEFSAKTLDELRSLARQNRPEGRALKAQQSMASGGVIVAASQFLPKVFFSTDYSYLAMRTDMKFRQDDFSKGFTSAVSLQIPLFGAGSNWMGLHKARMDQKITRDAGKQLDDGIAAEVEVAYNKSREARERYQSAKESIAMAEEAMRLANLMYEEGASTQLDVMGARLALTQARLNLVSALSEYQMARYGLRKAAGLLKGVL
jgi:outer membrane protein